MYIKIVPIYFGAVTPFSGSSSSVLAGVMSSLKIV